jgi:hypothetical protein
MREEKESLIFANYEPANAERQTSGPAPIEVKSPANYRLNCSTHPIHTSLRLVMMQPVCRRRAETANQLIFSVFSNPHSVKGQAASGSNRKGEGTDAEHLRRWMGTYSRRLGGRSPSRRVFASQFESAAVASRDPLCRASLLLDTTALTDSPEKTERLSYRKLYPP